ncbi:hypothetical protein [Streptomyces sp. NPDC060001]|uniref:hypothetical protein n=1 Tax=Streptomyces sp. NPDC060001 TaxID=3347032 RepID=UPI0036971D88
MTARELLIQILHQTDRVILTQRWGPEATVEAIADDILTGRDEETLHSAADDYEALTREQHPGIIYGAIRRIRAYKVGAYLRARADAATGHERATW